MEKNGKKARGRPSGKTLGLPTVRIFYSGTFDQLTRATPGSAGYDVRYTGTDVELENGKVTALGTGMTMEIPNGILASIRPRSGLATKGIIIPNSPGTIDADFRGEVKILLLNLSGNNYTIRNGDRIGQMIFERYSPIEVKFNIESPTETFPSQRGEGGFGSTGR